MQVLVTSLDNSGILMTFHNSLLPNIETVITIITFGKYITLTFKTATK